MDVDLPPSPAIEAERLPPSYAECVAPGATSGTGSGSGTGTGNHDVFPPATLYVAGRFVYADDPHAPPLYELSHSVGFLSDTDRVVRVERLDRAVKQPHGSTAPQVATRRRHMFDLTHPTLATSPAFPFHAEAISRQSLCSFGVLDFRPRRLSSAKGYRVHRASHAADHRLVCRDVLFTALPGGGEGVNFEWYDAQGGILAREKEEGELLSLLVSAEMAVRHRDALVSAWLLRVWWDLVKSKNHGKRWQEGMLQMGFHGSTPCANRGADRSSSEADHEAIKSRVHGLQKIKAKLPQSTE